MAAENNARDQLLQLFLEGASPDGRDEMGDTALCNAVIKGHKEIVTTLLRCHASPNARCSSGDTPLMYACDYGHRGIAETLLQHRALVDLKCRSETALMRAVQSYWNERVKNLWSANNAGMRNSLGESTDMLLSHRASVNMTDQHGLTPLMMAVRNEVSCSAHSVLALLEAGSSCNLRVNGQSAKDLAEEVHRRVIEQYEQENFVLLTLHASVLEAGASCTFSCTNFGGDELASGIADLQRPAASLYAMIASDLQSECFQLMLPNGQLVHNGEQLLGEAIALPAPSDE